MKNLVKNLPLDVILFTSFGFELCPTQGFQLRMWPFICAETRRKGEQFEKVFVDEMEDAKIPLLFVSFH